MIPGEAATQRAEKRFFGAPGGRLNAAGHTVQGMNDAGDVIELSAPQDGIPEIVTTYRELSDLAERLSSSNGPIAWDAERASGHRYSQRAYLIQGRRPDVGTFLIDPIAVDDLSMLTEAIAGTEWILHAASQDLPCMREVGLVPTGMVFDTELGGRLAGCERVGLEHMAVSLLGKRLAKEHSAANWSTRPLPHEWLLYAALDVELLHELRDAVAELLVSQGKMEWAQQEFDHVRDAPKPPPKPDPWRKTSGAHVVRGRRQFAVLREVWAVRDKYAQHHDIAAGRVFNDRVLVSIVKNSISTVSGLQRAGIPSAHRDLDFLRAIGAAVKHGLALPTKQLPDLSAAGDHLPPPRSWSSRRPQAARRLDQTKAVQQELSEQWSIPVENLMQPDTVRRICWDPPGSQVEQVAAACLQFGARPWQVELCVPKWVAAWRQPLDHAPKPERSQPAEREQESG